MPAFWYDPATEARDARDHELTLAGHARMLGTAVLVLALLVTALLLAR